MKKVKFIRECKENEERHIVPYTTDAWYECSVCSGPYLCRKDYAAGVNKTNKCDDCLLDHYFKRRKLRINTTQPNSNYKHTFITETMPECKKGFLYRRVVLYSDIPKEYYTCKSTLNGDIINMEPFDCFKHDVYVNRLGIENTYNFNKTPAENGIKENFIDDTNTPSIKYTPVETDNFYNLTIDGKLDAIYDLLKNT